MADPSETTQVSRQNVPEDQGELLGAVRSLAIQVGGLQAELHALRHEARTLPPGDGERPGWEEGQPLVRESPAWVRSVDSPGRRGLAVPWLLLEILFLIAVAVLAASANLDGPVIAAVMVVAWLLVVAGEWISSRGAARERAIVYGAAPPQLTSLPVDPTWFAPSSEETAPGVTANDRAATRLPPAQPE